MATKEIDPKIVAMAKKFEEAMASKPFVEQLSAGLISKRIINGCSWEFIPTRPEIENNKDEFRQNPNCSIQTVTTNHGNKIYGYLLYMKLDYLCNLLHERNCGPLSDKDIALALQHREDAKKSLIKKLKSKYKGRVGIYCTNDSQNITISGETFPAYAVTLKELCIICKNMNYGIVFGGKVRMPDDVLAREDGIIAKSTLAPSGNALLVEVAPLSGASRK